VKGKVWGVDLCVDALADRALERARAVEPEISRGVRAAAAEVGAEMAGYPEHVLKKPERLREKLAELTGEFPGKTPESLVHDVVRYTFVFDDDRYAEGVAAVRKAMERYPRLHEVTVYALREGRVTAVASSNPDEVGREAEVAAGSALSDGQIYAGTTREHAAAVFPLRDRNGDPMFALKLKMRTFAGQTRNNVAARGKIVADYLEEMVRAVDPDAP